MARVPDRTAILFFTHRFDAVPLERWDKLVREAGSCGTCYVQTQARDNPPPSLGPNTYLFDFEALLAQYPGIVRRSFLTNCQIPTLNFFREHEAYDYAWVVEYDACFSGHWSALFRAFDGDPSDLLCCHLRTFGDEPDWAWWRSLHPPHPDAAIPDDGLVRGFMPVYRLSRRAAAYLDARMKEGWRGHFEGLVPTLLRCGGFALRDIGGDGPFTPPGFRNRFYTSFDWARGAQSLFHFGTFRYRPTWARCGRRRNTLYHPVKPDPLTAADRAALRAERRDFVTRELRRSPRRLLLALARMLRRW
jgi:hypothetical protein